ncbi:MAG: cytidine deaminase [Gammaproteobacteria bacterium]|jgi:cytidine deaminase|nr:cytidine deaminase [Gammaproteobacteria bacterium]|tara:strand:- start:194 stop:586 length:393 start_codon:yes stop_codon:yes gene_type:complete
MNEENYIAATKEAMSKAYVPYSNYPVGALIVTDNGNTYSGCNVENASFPLGNCAEASAIASMVIGGEKKIKTIYVMTKNDEGGIPCGGCRQRIREFSDENTQIMMCSPDGVQQRINLSELLPNSFGPEHL